MANSPALQVVLTPEELGEIRRQAAELGLTASAYVRGYLQPKVMGPHHPKLPYKEVKSRVDDAVRAVIQLYARLDADSRTCPLNAAHHIFALLNCVVRDEDREIKIPTK